MTVGIVKQAHKGTSMVFYWVRVAYEGSDYYDHVDIAVRGPEEAECLKKSILEYGLGVKKVKDEEE